MGDQVPLTNSWQELWQQAYTSAHPTLSSIRDSLGSTTPNPRIMRVGQLDAELLDQELVHLLCEPLKKALNLVNVCLYLYQHLSLTAGKTALRVQFDSELTLVIQLMLYKFSLWNLGASYGARLQGLKYGTQSGPSSSVSLTRTSSLLE